MTTLWLLKFALSEPKPCFEQSDMIHILKQLTSYTVLRKKYLVSQKWKKQEIILVIQVRDDRQLNYRLRSIKVGFFSPF